MNTKTIMTTHLCIQLQYFFLSHGLKEGKPNSLSNCSKLGHCYLKQMIPGVRLQPFWTIMAWTRKIHYLSLQIADGHMVVDGDGTPPTPRAWTPSRPTTASPEPEKRGRVLLCKILRLIWRQEIA